MLARLFRSARRTAPSRAGVEFCDSCARVSTPVSVYGRRRQLQADVIRFAPTR